MSSTRFIWVSLAQITSSSCRFPADLVLDQRRLHDPRAEDVAHGIPENEWPAFCLRRARLDREQLVHLHLADDVARPVARLAQVEQLFEPDETAVRVGPAARSPAGMELARLGEVQLVRLDAQRRETS